MYVGSPLSEGVSGGDKNALQHYLLRRTYSDRNSAHARSLSEGCWGDPTRVVLLQQHLDIRAPTRGIFQYNNVLVPMVRRVARMRRHLASIRITYRYRQLYDVYEKSAGR
jgi:hypothetical protein